MSGAVGGEEEDVRSAVPVADLSVIDRALKGDGAIKDAVKKVRPADLGRDLSRRPHDDARALLDAIDDRRGAAMLRAAHPVVAAQLLSEIDAKRAVHLLGFVPTEVEVAILGQLEPAEQLSRDHGVGGAQHRRTAAVVDRIEDRAALVDRPARQVAAEVGGAELLDRGLELAGASAQRDVDRRQIGNRNGAARCIIALEGCSHDPPWSGGPRWAIGAASRCR